MLFLDPNIVKIEEVRPLGKPIIWGNHENRNASTLKFISK